MVGAARAGDRLPGGTVTIDGTPRSVHASLGGPGFRLLLCGPECRFPAAGAGEAGELARRYADLVSVHRAGATPGRRGHLDRWLPGR